MPIDTRTVLSDPDFQGLPLAEKNIVLMKIDPDYAGLPPAERAKALDAIHYGPQLGPNPNDQAAPGLLPKRGANSVSNSPSLPMVFPDNSAAMVPAEKIADAMKTGQGKLASFVLFPDGSKALVTHDKLQGAMEQDKGIPFGSLEALKLYQQGQQKPGYGQVASPGLLSGGGPIGADESIPHALVRQGLGAVGRVAENTVTAPVQSAWQTLQHPLGPSYTQENPQPAGSPELKGALPGYGNEVTQGLANRAKSGDVFGAGVEALGDIEAPRMIGAGVSKVFKGGPPETSEPTPEVIQKRASNLSTAMESGGKLPAGVDPVEDVAKPVLPALRAVAESKGITPDTFQGPAGARAAKDLTSSTRAAYDVAYNAMIDPVRDVPAGSAAVNAAQGVVQSMGKDAALIDQLTKSGDLQKLNSLAATIQEAPTIGALDDLREGLNRLSSKFLPKPGEQQYQSPLFQETLADGAKAIRDALYPEIAHYNGVPESVLRQLQIEHGAAIQLDNQMEIASNHVSRTAALESSGPGVLNRLLGEGVRGSVWVPRMIGGGSGAIAGGILGGPAGAGIGGAAGAALGEAFRVLHPPSEVDLFNTQMKRALEGINPVENPAPPYQRPTPQGGPLVTPLPPDTSYVRGVPSGQPPEPSTFFERRPLASGNFGRQGAQNANIPSNPGPQIGNGPATPPAIPGEGGATPASGAAPEVGKGANSPAGEYSDIDRVLSGPHVRASNDATKISPEAYQDIGKVIDSYGKAPTIKQVLEGSGPVIVDRLIQDGVIRPQERVGLVKGLAGDLTERGRLRLIGIFKAFAGGK